MLLYKQFEQPDTGFKKEVAMTIMTNDSFTGHFAVSKVHPDGYAFLQANSADVSAFVPPKVVKAAGLVEGQKVVAKYSEGQRGFVAFLVASDDEALAKLQEQQNRPRQQMSRGIGGKTPPNAKQLNAARKAARAAEDRQRRQSMKGKSGK